MAIVKRNYVPGQFESITDEPAGIVTHNEFQYFELDGFYKFEVANPIIKIGGSTISAADYTLAIDEKYTGLEIGKTNATLYSQIKFTNPIHDGLEFTVAGQNFGTMVDNEATVEYVNDRAPESIESYETYPITVSGTAPQEYKTALINSGAGEVNLVLPEVLAGDDRWYGFKLDQNSHHCNITVAGASLQKIQDLETLSISTENSTVIVKANGVDGYSLIWDTRLYNRSVLVEDNLDLTSGFESGGIYFGHPADAGSAVITIKNWSIEHNGDFAYFTKIGGANSTYRIVSEDGSFDEVINEDATGIRLSVSPEGYTISQDSRAKSQNVRINFLPTGDPSALEPTYNLLRNDAFPENILTSAPITSSDSANPTSLGFWLNDDKALIGSLEAQNINALGELKKTIDFNRDVAIRFRYYQYDYDTLTLDPTPILTTGYSQAITSFTGYEQVFVSGILPARNWAFADESFTNTLTIELQAIKIGTGGVDDDPTLDIKTGGDTPSRTYIDVPIASVNHNILGGVTEAATGRPDGHVNSSIPLQQPELTTTEINEYATPNDGMTVWDKTISKLKLRIGVVWDYLVTKLELTRSLGASPFDYGAVGDGIVDDTTAVQNCFNSNTLVNLSGGVFLCGDIVMQDGTEVFGGKLKGKTGATNILSLSLESELNGVEFETTDNTVAVLVDHGTNTDYSKKFFRIINCDFKLCYTGVEVKASSGTKLAGAAISNCNFYGIENRGVLLQTDAEYITITGSSFSECNVAIEDFGGNVIITSNQITGTVPTEDTFPWSPSTIGILLSAGGNDAHGLIANNNINHCKFYGLRVGNLTVRTMQIANNHFIDADVRLDNAGLQFVNNRFTTTAFTFTGTVGTVFLQSVVNDSPTITYSGTCNVTWDGTMKVDGGAATLPNNTLYNGSVKNTPNNVHLFTGVDLALVIGNSEFYVTSPTNRPPNASNGSGFVRSVFATGTIAKMTHKPYNSNEIWENTRPSGAWGGWSLIGGDATDWTVLIDDVDGGIEYMRFNGRVEFRGSRTAGTAPLSWPVNFRPSEDLSLMVTNRNTLSSPGVLDVTAAGTIQFLAGGEGTHKFGGLSFIAEQ
jgi:hypothetical protein